MLNPGCRQVKSAPIFTHMKALLQSQYELVLKSREILLSYCATVSQDDFVRSSSQVGNGGSIRNLLVHINNSYHGWLKHFAMKESFEKKAYEDLFTLKDCEQHFSGTDIIVQRFLDHFVDCYEQPIEGVLASRDFLTSPLQLFTHVITHEYHHKGQIILLSKMWGYQPVDTDILR